MTFQLERFDPQSQFAFRAHAPSARPAPPTRERRNLTDQQAEDFKPPLFRSNTSLRGRLENRLRRFLDLQAGSAWRDLRGALADAHGRLLDVGCGAQIYRDLVPAEVAYLGIDTSDAKARFGYELPDVHYFDGDEWGVPEAAFDVVLCTEVLEHVAQPAPFLARIHRCLRPGGQLVLTVPFAARWHFIPFDFWRYTPSSLDMLLRDAGFEKVRVQARGNPVTVACYKAMALQLMLLFTPERGMGGFIRRCLGLALSPLLLASIGNWSLWGDWGDDCLGYTVTARREA